MIFKLQPGINDCTNEQYHADKSYLSSSTFKKILESPADYHASLTAPEPAMTGAHLDLGSYVHSLLLEPHLVATEYAVFPGFRRAGKDYELFKLQNPNKAIVSASMQNAGQRMALSVQNCPPAIDLLKGGISEQSIALLLNDVPCKARFDKINVDKRAIIDVKTSRHEADKATFKETIKEYGYDLSAALYLQVAEAHYGHQFDFYWLVIFKTEPPETRVYKASEKTLLAGATQLALAMQTYKKCLQTGLWVDSEDETCETENQQIIEEI